MSSDFSVVAIVAAFNEADVIGPVVSDLIDQGLRVYFLDDGSTDGTVEAVEPFVGRGVLAIERLRPPAPAPAQPFDWERILLRKGELTRELDADWFLHHDADEFRESPWAQLTLHDAIRQVDALGFNAIDFLSLDFWPIHDDFRPGDDVRAAFPFYAEGAVYNRLQIRCWKKSAAPVDLVSSGGHDATFPGRQVFPLRFITRHYPIRGQAHGERKVFDERRNRLREDERARGWHVQYDDVREGASFIRDRSTLTRYDGDAIRAGLALRHRGVEALDVSFAAALAAAEALRLEHEAQRATLEETRAQLDAARADHEALTRELARNQDALARANADVTAKSAEAETLRHALEHRAREVAGLQGAVIEGTRRLDEFQRSLSWRWTSPARAAYRVLRGR